MDEKEANSIAKALVAGYVAKEGIPRKDRMLEVVKQLAEFHAALVEQLRGTEKNIDVSDLWTGDNRLKKDF
jgi:hypothetical protein